MNNFILVMSKRPLIDRKLYWKIATTAFPENQLPELEVLLGDSRFVRLSAEDEVISQTAMDTIANHFTYTDFFDEPYVAIKLPGVSYLTTTKEPLDPRAATDVIEEEDTRDMFREISHLGSIYPFVHQLMETLKNIYLSQYQQGLCFEGLLAYIQHFTFTVIRPQLVTRTTIGLEIIPVMGINISSNFVGERRDIDVEIRTLVDAFERIDKDYDNSKLALQEFRNIVG